MNKVMSLVENKTFELFSSFMPRRKEIPHRIGEVVFDVRDYSPDYYRSFSPANTFTKWALAEVASIDTLPEGMDSYQLEGGMYAVFKQKGPNKDPNLFRYIFTQWLPGSNYLLDDRPHFDILNVGTRKNDPEAEEEIWIPIKSK